jgi:hypothetical protein
VVDVTDNRAQNALRRQLLELPGQAFTLDRLAVPEVKRDRREIAGRIFEALEQFVVRG